MIFINRTPSSILKGKTPYEVLYGKQPSYDHLRVVGCVCYIHNQDHKGDKFVSRSKKCVFVGYPHGKKGWRVYDIEKGTFSVSRDVVFREDTFHYQLKLGEDGISFLDSQEVFDLPAEEQSSVDKNGSTDAAISPIDPVLEQRPEGDGLIDPTPRLIDPVVDHRQSEIGSPEPANTSPNPVQLVNAMNREEAVAPVPPVRVGERERRPPGYLQDYDTSFVCTEKCTYPIEEVVSCTRFSANHRVFLTAITNAVA